MNFPQAQSVIGFRKSPAGYYTDFFTQPQFSDQKLLGRTLDFAISPDVRSQDAQQPVAGVLGNPDDEEAGLGLHSAALERN